VHALLLRWASDDLGVVSEIKDLNNVFQQIYQYNVQLYDIPNFNPDRMLKKRLIQFLEPEEMFGNEILFIVYYAGHARRKLHSTDAPIWVA